MELRLLGLSHKTAPVEVREKIVISSARLKEALTFFGGREVVILSTCNRTEIYTVGDNFEASIRFLENYFKIWFSEVEKYLYRYSGAKAAEHLMRVASGLDYDALMLLSDPELQEALGHGHYRGPGAQRPAGEEDKYEPQRLSRKILWQYDSSAKKVPLLRRHYI